MNGSHKMEWLETDGLGGFASGTALLGRTRRYHALLLPATTPPTGRLVLVNGLDAWATTSSGTYALTSQRYAPGVTHPDGEMRIESFDARPWPRWLYRLEDGTRIELELFVSREVPLTALRWRLLSGSTEVKLSARLFFSGRDYHSTHHENAAFRFAASPSRGGLTWAPYPGLPSVHAFTNASYAEEPLWYRNFLYEEEQARGLDCTEDLASPGVLTWDLKASDAVCLLGASSSLPPEKELVLAREPLRWHGELREAELERRSAFEGLEAAVDSYIVRRGRGRTLIAGYPWFTDWGRDTFIAIRGLCIALGRLDEALDMLLEWPSALSEGMLPNRFTDSGAPAEFNSVDASLWYVIAAHELLQAMERAKHPRLVEARDRMHGAMEEILTGFSKGTRYNIHATEDGLLAAGTAGVQLTWMDAKVGDWVVTPRIGKPVEIQALWLNALWIRSLAAPRWREMLSRGLESFKRRFWRADARALHDVVDCDHQAGAFDASFRPNQIFAVGGLPLQILEGDEARAVVDAVESRLWTPVGLRTLERGAPGYTGTYQGGPLERDGAYHQGTAWPWLLGPFVEAWVRVRGSTREAKREARGRFLAPLLACTREAGLGHIPEIYDAEPPQHPRGCPFQAWSVGEALRLDRVVLADGQGPCPGSK